MSGWPSGAPRPQVELEQARAERDVALAQIARNEGDHRPQNDPCAVPRPHRNLGCPRRAIPRDGTQLTTLQGVDDAANVDFSVAQSVAATLKVGEMVQVIATTMPTPIAARIVAVDARVDPTTRNAMVRARID